MERVLLRAAAIKAGGHDGSGADVVTACSEGDAVLAHSRAVATARAPPAPPRCLHITQWGLATLAITHCYQLAALPLDSIALLAPTLRTLDLSHNALQSLPAALCRGTRAQGAAPDASAPGLPVLTTLLLNNNRLVTLPPDIRHARKLLTLNVENNSIVALPNAVRGLDYLQKLHCANNSFLGDEDEVSSASSDSGDDDDASATSRGGSVGSPAGNAVLRSLVAMCNREAARGREIAAADAAFVASVGAAAAGAQPPRRPAPRDTTEPARWAPPPAASLAATVAADEPHCSLCGAPLMRPWAGPKGTTPFAVVRFVDFLGNKSMPVVFFVCPDLPLLPGTGSRKKRRDPKSCGAVLCRDVADAEPTNFRRLVYDVPIEADD